MYFHEPIFLSYLIGKEPWTFDHKHTDHQSIEDKSKHTPIEYPKPDGEVTFDLLSSVALTGTNHEADQPPHLTLLNDDVPVQVNYERFDGPEGKFCPAGNIVFTLINSILLHSYLN